ncbi:MAG: ATP-binding cassette domain-containing protein [Mongoliibacter sp.]|uniref:ABC transporter ATP-binding protein n=1 Tax=Mongoliibacter sp. TaxID=2022438 RepID=UPI0012F2BC23|nr:ATP-binding cassette domain-containing protein [Mongoliibacter sp.]TVP52180.1 MAG: ATP-binding cassette domain-containing protein [Mongoliibacter sp.]
MLTLDFINAGKRFQYDWIFRKLTYHIPPGTKCVITGSNGSGKSTLLKSISAIQPLTEGNIKYTFQAHDVAEADLYKYLVISAPYLELPEEFTLLELLHFHFKFKNPIPGIGFSEMMEIMYLDNQQHKSISQFSSGMKQRLKIGLCVFSDVPLVLFDEPTSNLDQKGVEWYLNMVEAYCKEKTLIICSNEPKEYVFCNEKIHIEDYKLKSKL